MLNSLRFKEESQRNIRLDDLEHNELSLVDVQTSLYCLYILIKQNLDDYKNGIIDWKDFLMKSLDNQKKFIDELGKQHRNHQPISQDVYKKFFLKFELEPDEQDDKAETYAKYFFKCLRDNIHDELMSQNAKKQPMLRKPKTRREGIVNEILLQVKGTATIIDDALTPYISDGMFV